MKKFLHVGCGRKHKDRTTAGFNSPDWTEVRFDIDVDVNPDIVGTMTDLGRIESGSMAAIFSSHNIEHLYPHEVEIALREFRRVLRPDGFAVITCPDLQSICELVAKDKLMEPAYTSPAGPISPIDMLYGFRASIQAGNHYMAHRCGFTKSVLSQALHQAGFITVGCDARGSPAFDLWALAMAEQADHSRIIELVKEHFPA